MNPCTKKSAEYCNVNSSCLLNSLDVQSFKESSLKTSHAVSRQSSRRSLCSALLIESSSCSESLIGELEVSQTRAKERMFKESIEDMKEWIIDQGNDFETPEDFMEAYTEQIRNKFEIPVERFFVGYLVPVEDSAYSFKWETPNARVERRVLKNMSRRHTQYGSDAPFNVLQEKRANSIRIRSSDQHIPSDCQWFREGGYTDYYSLPITCRSEVLGGAAWSTKHPLGFSVKQIQLFQKSIRSLSSTIRNLMNEQIVHELVQRPKEETSEEKCCKEMKRMAMISHELRTPLNGIISMAQLIQDDDNLNGSQKESLRVITQSGEFLMGIVNDVLDYSKLQTLVKENGKRMNKDMFVIQPLRLRDILKAVAHTIRIQCRKRQIHLNVSYFGRAEDPNVILHTDGTRLQQILYNLLGNAVKFSKEGGTIEFLVSLADDSVQFVIKDYGTGIRKENLFSIFEPYSQVKCASHNANGGTGLGLTLTKMLTTCLGGTLTADSVYGEWTEFKVNLPLQQSATSEQHPVDPATEPTNVGVPSRSSSQPFSKEDIYSNLRVLVADDNMINQKILLRILRQLKITHIDLASNGREAVQKATTKSYDVILMDIEMPVTNGISAMKAILSQGGLKSPQFAFATAHKSLDHYKDEMGGLSCSRFLSKPFCVRQIDDLLSELVLE